MGTKMYAKEAEPESWEGPGRGARGACVPGDKVWWEVSLCRPCRLCVGTPSLPLSKKGTVGIRRAQEKGDGRAL